MRDIAYFRQHLVARIFLSLWAFLLILLNAPAGGTDAFGVSHSRNSQCPGPVITSFYPQDAHAQDMTASGNYLYFAVDHDYWWEGDILHLKPGLQVWNVSNPESPQYVDTISAGSAGQDANAWSLEVAGFYAYVGFGQGGDNVDAPGGILIVNIADPEHPGFETVHSFSAGQTARALAVQGNYIYAVIYENQVGYRLQILDISNLAQINELGQLSTPRVRSAGLVASGNYLYLATGSWAGSGGNGGVWIVDVSNPNQPVAVTKHPLPSPGDESSIWAPSLDLNDNYAYVGYTDDDTFAHGGLQIVNISNPLSPIDAGSVEIGTDLIPRSVNVDGDFAYLAVDGGNSVYHGLVAINIQNPAQPLLVGHTAITSPWRSSIGNGYAFVSSGTSLSPVSVIDISGCVSVQAENSYLLWTR